MSKVIQSPVKRFPGSVTLYDPVPYPNFIEWEKAINADGEGADLEKQLTMWHGVKAMTEKWEIPEFDIENPIATPRAAVISLLAWLVTEIGKIINEVEESPNA